MQTFLDHGDDRLVKYMGDPRFRGVYFLLANLMPFDDAMALREVLMEYAVDSKDHNVFDGFVRLLRERKNTIAAAKQAATAAVSET